MADLFVLVYVHSHFPGMFWLLFLIYESLEEFFCSWQVFVCLCVSGDGRVVGVVNRERD